MSSAAKVELYISKRPYLKEALAEGVVNYSALARKVVEDEGLDSFDAVKVAISRYEDHISREREKRRSKVEDILGKTVMKVEPGVRAKKEEVEDPKVRAVTSNGHTSVVDGGDKALISLESPEDLENTPGVIEFILSSLAAEGINIDHLISCREDTHFLVDQEDAAEALDLLNGKLSD